MWDKTTQCVDTTKQAIYCKYGIQCEKNHYNNICQVQVCRSRACTDRHPRTCKYFSNNGDCRYKDKCAYVHAFDKEYEKLEMLEKDIAILKDEVKKLSKITQILLKGLQI